MADSRQYQEKKTEILHLGYAAPVLAEFWTNTLFPCITAVDVPRADRYRIPPRKALRFSIRISI